MKLWLLTTEYPPQSGGGVSTYCWHTAKMMAAEGIDVTVFIPARQAESSRIVRQDERIRLIYFRQEDNPQNKFLGWEAALSYEFANVLHHFAGLEGPPDFIESQEYGGIAYYALQRRLLDSNYLKGSVFYITAHAPGFLYLDYNQAPYFQFPDYWIGEMERSVLQTADFVLSPSQYLLDELSGRVDLGSVTTRVIRNPFSSFNRAPEFTQGDLVFFGKLTPQKGGLEMLQYFQEMWDNGFSGVIRIIGGGDHFFYPKMMDMGDYIRKKFSAYIKKGLLIFEGHVPPSQLESRLSKAHVVIVPSTVDNLPYTVLEAMSMGKVVLVSKQGGHAELIDHGSNGFVFSHHEPDSFARVLNEILGLSEKVCLEIGEMAQRTIDEQCAYRSVFGKKLALLQNLKPKRSSADFPFIRTRSATSSGHAGNGKKDLLSIIIPYHNLGDFIKDCVQSVLKADYPSKEVIIINDGSADSHSVKILEEIEKQYPVRVIHQTNIGLCDTRNKGAGIAAGEFLAFLDADDTVDPSYYSKAIRILRKFDNVSFVGCWAKYFGENDEIWPAFNPEPPYLLTHNTINSSALVYKTSHFIQAGGNDPKMVYGMEDYETVVNLVKHGYRGVVIPEILWNYRIRTGSMAQSFNRFSELYLYRLISRKHADFFAEYAEEIVNILNANGPSMSYKNPTLAIPEYRTPFRINSRMIKFIRRNKFLRKLAKKIYTWTFSH